MAFKGIYQVHIRQYKQTRPPPPFAQTDLVLELRSYSTDQYAADHNERPYWILNFGGNGSQSATDICVADNGDAIVLAETTPSNVSLSNGNTRLEYTGAKVDILIARIGVDDGSIKWTKTISGDGNQFLNSITTAKDGSMYACGSFQKKDGSWDALLIKFTSDGDLQWEKTFDWGSDDHATDIKRDSKGGFFISGTTNGTIKGQVNHGGSDGYIIQVDTSGSISSAVEFGETGDESGTSLAVGDDGSIYAGWTNQYGAPLVGKFTAELPIVTLDVSPASVKEDGKDNLIYTFTRTGSASNDLIVNYTVSGTAILVASGSDAADYSFFSSSSTAASRTTTILAGFNTATITVDPTADTKVESDETVALKLAASTDYTIGTTEAVVGTITNDDIAPATPTISKVGGDDKIVSSIAGDNQVLLTATAGTTVKLYSGSTLLGPAVAVTGTPGSFSYSLTTTDLQTIGQGQNKSITAKATDSYGNISSASTPFSFAVFNDSNTVITSTSSSLAQGKSTLVLTGTRNIWGTGNQSDNTIIGNSGDNRITGGGGKDTLTGNAGTDSFIYNNRSDSLLGSGGTGSYDVITDFNPNDRIIGTFDLEGETLSSSVGQVDSLTPTNISNLLTSSKFDAYTAVAFTSKDALGATFIALNDGSAGFQAGSDSIIKLMNYTIGSSNPVTVI